MSWLYRRPVEATLACIESKFAKRPEIVEANPRRSGRAGTSARPPRPSRSPTRSRRRRSRRASTATSPATRRSPAAWSPRPSSRPAALPRRLPDHARRRRSCTSSPATRTSASSPSRPRTRSPPSAPRSAPPSPARSASTATAGPGFVLKQEAVGLAIALELPLVILDIQRAGPVDRHADEARAGRPPDGALRPQRREPGAGRRRLDPGDCFDAAIEAARIAVKYMTPVVLLSDGYLANGSEPWRIPDVDDLPDISTTFAEAGPEPFQPYLRDPRRSRGRGRSRARRASSTGSAGSRRRT